MMTMTPVLEIPIGFTFEPSDIILIKYYLSPKVQGKQPFFPNIIPEIDVYATEPWNLGIEFKHGKDRNAIYCFTRATRSGASDGRLLRGAGNGTWHASGQRMFIYNDGAVIGTKMTNLKFVLPTKKGSKPVATSWIMHEYRSLDSPVDDQGKEIVLCRIQNSRTGISNDQQLPCVVDDYTTSTANLQQQKRKRNQHHCCKNDRMVRIRCNMPAPPSIVSSYDEQKLRMINTNPCSSIGTYTVSGNNLLQQLGMPSLNNSASTNDQTQQEGMGDELSNTITTTLDDEFAEQLDMILTTTSDDEFAEQLDMILHEGDYVPMLPF